MQTVYQTQTTKAKVCFVVVPDGYDFQMMKNGIFRYRIKGVSHFKQLPIRNWQLIGPLSEVTEEQAAQLVDQFEDVMYGDISPLTWLKNRTRSLGIPEGQNVVVLAEFINKRS